MPDYKVPWKEMFHSDTRFDLVPNLFRETETWCDSREPYMNTINVFHLSVLVTCFVWWLCWTAVPYRQDIQPLEISQLSPFPAWKTFMLSFCVNCEIFTDWLNNGLIIEKCRITQPTPLPREQSVQTGRESVRAGIDFPIRGAGLTKVVLRVTKWNNCQHALNS